MRVRIPTNFKHALNTIRQCFYSLLFLYSVTFSTYSTVFYIDYQSGNDNQSGISINEAWKHCPGDSASTNIPANISLKPGDTIKFKGGVEYFGTVQLKWSGESNSPIVYDGNLENNWGVGSAVIDNRNTLDTAFTAPNPVAFVSIVGFEIRNVGGYSDSDPILAATCESGAIKSPNGGTGIDFQNGGSDLKIQSVFLNRIGQWRNQPPFSGANSVTGTGISLQNVSNVLINACEFTKMRCGISLKTSARGGGSISDVTVTNCNLHNYMVWPIDIAPRSSGVSLKSIHILNSKIHDYNEFDAGNWLGCGEKPHSDGIFVRTADMPDVIWEDILIAGNDFYSDEGANSQGGTAAIYVSQGPSLTIINNVFRGVRHTRTIGVGHWNPTSSPKQIVNIANNTFVDSNKAILMDGETNILKREVNILNNIFVNVSDRANSVSVMFTELAPNRLDFNIYYSPLVSVKDNYVAYRDGYFTFSALQGAGFEKNGSYVNPRLARIDVDVATAASSINAIPLAASPALRKGKQLDYVTTDKVGLERNTLIPGVGAYISPAPTTPQGFRIK